MLSYSRGVIDPPLLEETIGQNLRRTVERFGEREALVVRDQGYRATYRELWDQVDIAARALLANGVGKGERVGIWAPTAPSGVVMQFATAQVGASGQHQPGLQGGRARVRAAQGRRQPPGDGTGLPPSGLRGDARVGPGACPELRIVIVLEDDWDTFLAEGACLDGRVVAKREATLDPRDPINIQYTLGTTGFPKGATLSHRNILKNGHMVARTLRYTERDRVCVPVPFYHCFGMVLGILVCVTQGACVVVPGEQCHSSTLTSARLRATTQRRWLGSARGTLASTEATPWWGRTEGEIVAAIDLTSGAVLADPARSTSELVHALRRRRYELLRQGGTVQHARFALAPRGREPNGAIGRNPVRETKLEPKEHTMGKHRGRSRWARISIAAVVVLLAATGSAVAFQALPPGSQVNDDPMAGISPAAGVNGEDPTNADVVGGALVAGKPAVPWAIFRQQEASGARPDLLALVCRRGLDDPRERHGRWPLERQPDVRRVAQLRPGPGRRGAGDRLRGSRSDRAVGDLVREHHRHRLRRQQHLRQPVRQHWRCKWVFAGQGRGNGGSGPAVPSLNIHTDQSAENPSVAGGSAVDPTKPGPWVTWQETTTRRSMARTRSSSPSRWAR